MVKRKKIVVFIDWYVPAYKAGGPVRSVYNLIESFSNDYEFFVITTNLDLDGSFLNEITSNQWQKQGKANVLYLEQKQISGERFKNEVGKITPEVIYVNSLFSLKFTLLPLFLFKKERKVLLAPRGMLGKASLEIKRTKKRIFLFGAKYLGVFRNVIWHATSLQEKTEIQNVFGKQAKVIVSSNVALVNDKVIPIKKEPNSIKILIAGRIVPIKNVLFFLDVLKDIEHRSKVELTLAGPIEDAEYWNKCKTVIDQLPDNVQVKSTGAIPPLEVVKLIQNHHLLVSVSLNENFGHSIAEALCNGRPVLVSNHTPWKNLKEKGVGMNLDLNKKAFKEAVEFFLSCDNACFENYTNNAITFAKEIFKPDCSVFDEL